MAQIERGLTPRLVDLAAELHRAQRERADHQTGTTEGPKVHAHANLPRIAASLTPHYSFLISRYCDEFLQFCWSEF